LTLALKYSKPSQGMSSSNTKLCSPEYTRGTTFPHCWKSLTLQCYMIYTTIK